MLAALLLAVLVGQPATSEAEAPLLTLDEARALAERANYDLRIARERLAQARVLANKSWTVLAPVITASASAVRNDQAIEFAAGLPEQLRPLFEQLGQPFPDPEIITIQDLYQQSASASFNWPLINGRAIPLIRNALASADLAELSFTQAQAAVLYATSVAYYNLLSALRQVAVQERAVANTEAHLAVTRAQRDVGEATELAVLRAEVELAADEQNLIRARNAEQIARLALAVLIGWLDEAGNVRPFRVAAPELEVPLPEGDLVRLAYDERLDLKSRRIELDIAERSKLETWFRFLPTIAGTGTLRWSSTEGFQGDNTTWQIGLALQWSIFEGGRTLFELRERQHEINAAMLAIERLRQEVAREVREAELNLASARASLEVAERRAELAERSLRLAEVQYRAGVATQLDLLDASRALANAETAQTIAELNYNLAQLTLRQTLIASTDPVAAPSAPEQLEPAPLPAEPIEPAPTVPAGGAPWP